MIILRQLSTDCAVIFVRNPLRLLEVERLTILRALVARNVGVEKCSPTEPKSGRIKKNLVFVLFDSNVFWMR